MNILHEAVIRDDMRLVLKYAQDKSLAEARDILGFTAQELAFLLGRERLIELLVGIDNPIVYKDGKEEILTSAAFATTFHVQFRPSLFFASYDALKTAVKECPWVLKGPLGEENRELANIYRGHIFGAISAPVHISYIDETIGYGLFAAAPLSRGDYIGTYAGLVRRISRLHRTHNAYCLHYPTRWFSFRYHVIDSLTFGNATRFINHSYEPNICPKGLLDRGVLHTAFFALEDIDAGEELRFNYGRDFWSRRIAWNEPKFSS